MNQAPNSIPQTPGGPDRRPENTDSRGFGNFRNSIILLLTVAAGIGVGMNNKGQDKKMSQPSHPDTQQPLPTTPINSEVTPVISASGSYIESMITIKATTHGYLYQATGRMGLSLTANEIQSLMLPPSPNIDPELIIGEEAIELEKKLMSLLDEIEAGKDRSREIDELLNPNNLTEEQLELLPYDANDPEQKKRRYYTRTLLWIQRSISRMLISYKKFQDLTPEDKKALREYWKSFIPVLPPTTRVPESERD